MYNFLLFVKDPLKTPLTNGYCDIIGKGKYCNSQGSFLNLYYLMQSLKQGTGNNYATS